MGYALQTEMTESNYEYLVVGLGETGFSLATFLYDCGASFAVADTRENPPLLDNFRRKFPSVETYLGEFSFNTFSKAKQIVLSPGVDVHNEVIQSAINVGVQCCGDIELFVNNTQIPIVAITGSNGKSTVTSLVAEMANNSGIRAYAGGNLGPPALELLSYDDAELFILELSSFQLEITKSLSAKVAAVLNISADHLDRHGDLHNYATIKARIYEHAKNSVINRDDDVVTSMNTSGDVASFGLKQGVNNEFGLIHKDNKVFLAKGDRCLLSIDKVAMPGESGILNSLAGLAIGDALGMQEEKMLATLTVFKGLPHRFSLTGVSNEVAWFNDSKGTNIGATISSLRGLKENIILLAGGVFKGGDLSLLHNAVSKYVKHVILFGKDANILKANLAGAATIHLADSMRDAVSIARSLAQAGDKVLLSPACASFDLYKNYVARGEDFEACVKELVL